MKPHLTQRRHRLVAVALVLVGFIAYVGLSAWAERQVLRLEVQEQGKQLSLSMEAAVNVVRKHIHMAQRMVNSDWGASPAANGTQDIVQSESGTLLITPSVERSTLQQDRVLGAAVRMLPAVAASHQWDSVFQWTYFLDARARWLLTYPALSEQVLLKATQTPELGAALRVVMDVAGTRHNALERMSPAQNPAREMRWTSSYEDGFGKGRVVSLLAPVDRAHDYVGVVGTKITVQQIDELLNTHAPRLGRALIVDAQGEVLADGGGALKNRPEALTLSQLFSPQDLPVQGHPDWQRLPLHGTPWTLWVQASDRELLRVVAQEMRLNWGVVAALAFALLAIWELLQRRKAALILTTESLETTRSALVRADRLGALGGVIGGVSRLVESPLRQVDHALQVLREGLEAFQAQQQRGLRRAELLHFVALVDKTLTDSVSPLHTAQDVLDRFRLLAVDQAREGERDFSPHELVGHVQRVLLPASQRPLERVESLLAPDLILHSDPGALGYVLHGVLSDALNRSSLEQRVQLIASWVMDPQGEALEMIVLDQGATPPDLRSEAWSRIAQWVGQGLRGGITAQTTPTGHRVILRLPARAPVGAA